MELRKLLAQIPQDVTRKEIRKICDEEVLKTHGIEIKCLDCGNIFLASCKNVGKTCPACKEIKLIEGNRRFHEIEEQYRRSQEEREKLDIEAFYEGRGKAYTSFQLIDKVLSKEDFEKLKVMPYKDFLQTPYWKTVSNYVRYRRNYKCQLCGSSVSSNVHHRDYVRHGEEHKYWDTDLILLCQDCHSKFHSTLEVTNG